MNWFELCREFIRKYRQQQIDESEIPFRLRSTIWVNGNGSGPEAAKKFYQQLMEDCGGKP